MNITMPRTIVKRRIRVRGRMVGGDIRDAKVVKTYPPRSARRAKPSVVRIRQRTIPDKMIVKLPYADLQGVNGAGGAAFAAKYYNINGLYDPETGTLNQQNLGFDEYMKLYQNYRVFKVDYDITVVNTSASAVAGSLCIAPTGAGMVISDIQQLNMPYSKRFTLGLGGASTSSSAQSMKRLKGSIYLPRVHGRTPEQFRTDMNFAGSVTTNPTNGTQLGLNFININNSVGATLQVDARYTCHVELFNRVQIFGTDAPVEH